MSKRKKKVVTTQEFMEKARYAIEKQDTYEREVSNFCIALINSMDEVLSDGQKHQMERFMDEFERATK